MSPYKPSRIKQIYHTVRRYIAGKWLNCCHNVIQIAITGSQGKTNVTKIVTAVAQSLGNTVVTDLNLDTSFNVPITALKVLPSTKFVVWELGIDHPGEMDKHLEIVKPTIGIITGISPVHTDEEHMGSLEKLIQEKRKLIEVLPAEGYAILNYDDEHVRAMSPFTKAKNIWYGTDSNHCDVWTEKDKIKVNIDGTTLPIFSKAESFTLQTKLIGTFHAHNLLIGLAVLKLLSSKQKLGTVYQQIINTVKPLRGRMNIEPGPLETVILNDSLRANPESTRAGLETLDRMEYKGRKIAVIGEMGELQQPEFEHRNTGKQIAKLNLEYVLCIGPLRKYTIEEALEYGFPREKIAYAADVCEAAEKLKEILKPGDLWYLKGSLLRNYKRIIQLLNGGKICCQALLCPYSHCGY